MRTPISSITPTVPPTLSPTAAPILNHTTTDDATSQSHPSFSDGGAGSYANESI